MTVNLGNAQLQGLGIKQISSFFEKTMWKHQAPTDGEMGTNKDKTLVFLLAVSSKGLQAMQL